MPAPADPSRRSPDASTAEAVIRAAINAFNDGDDAALRPDPTGRRAQEVLGCSAGRRCHTARPMPLAVGASHVTIDGIHMLDHRRAICRLRTIEGIEMTGVYAVDAGRLTAACHYFSDVDALIQAGILEADAEVRSQPVSVPATSVAPSPLDPGDHVLPVLGDRLRETRLALRQDRLELVLRALDERTHAAGDGGIPMPLVAAITDFQRELGEVRAALRDLNAAAP